MLERFVSSRPNSAAGSPSRRPAHAAPPMPLMLHTCMHARRNATASTQPSERRPPATGAGGQHSPLEAPHGLEGLHRLLVVVGPLVVVERRQPEVARSGARKLWVGRGLWIGWLGGWVGNGRAAQSGRAVPCCCPWRRGPRGARRWCRTWPPAPRPTAASSGTPPATTPGTPAAFAAGVGLGEGMDERAR